MNDSSDHGSLATRLAALQQRMRTHASSSDLWMRAAALKGPLGLQTPAISGLILKQVRPQQPPILIGASKTQPVDMLEEAILLGLRDFGENRVQEAMTKWPALKNKYPHIRLHLIGPLQSNKAEDAMALFDVIHTIDRIKIAEALAAAAKKLGNHPQCLLQINTGEEPQKAGVTPREAAALLAHCRTLDLTVTGLMCVPPEGENPAPHFALLKKMADVFALQELSMGMSSDFEIALRLGATMVRVGTALFGGRATAVS